MFLINLLLLNKSDARKWATSWQNCRRVLLIPFKKSIIDEREDSGIKVDARRINILEA